MKHALRGLIDCVYPDRCAACRSRGKWLCDRCLALCVPHGDSHCPRCGSRTDDVVCRTCPHHIRHLDGLRAAYEYSGPVRSLVHSFKYDGLHASAGWMVARMPVEWLPAQAVLVPVPLHPRCERERGYNQSDLLARALNRRTGLPVVHSIQRVRHTSPQAQQDAAGRWTNIRGAFEPREGLHARDIVVLVDDVCTTGATLEECARVAIEMGAGRVLALVFART